MANPNILSATSLKGYGKVINLTTTNATGIVTNTSSSNQIVKVNCVRATNYDGVNNCDISLSVYDSSEASTGYLAYTIAVVADSTFNVIDKTESIYLEEGDYLQATASAANDISIYVAYEVIE